VVACEYHWSKTMQTYLVYDNKLHRERLGVIKNRHLNANLPRALI